MTAQRNLAWPVYFASQLDSGPGVPTEVTLEADEARHAAVRRHRPGEWIVVTAGQGRWAAGPVTKSHGKSGVTMSVHLAGDQPEAEPTITVIQALPKSERAEEAVELLTAVGVDRIIPWQAERSVARWSSDRVERGLARWRRAAAESAKQSRRVRWPIICPPVGGKGLVEVLEQSPMVLMCHEQATTPIGAVPVVATATDIVIVVGPEGGITQAEQAVLARAGAVAVSLGPTVLRTSVAGGVAAALVISRVGGRLAATTPDDQPGSTSTTRVDAAHGAGAP